MRSRFRIATIAHPLVVRSNVAGLAVSPRQETEVASTRTSRPTFASDCIISLTWARLPYRVTLRSGQTNRSSRQNRVITIRHRTIRSERVAYSATLISHFTRSTLIFVFNATRDEAIAGEADGFTIVQSPKSRLSSSHPMDLYARAYKSKLPPLSKDGARMLS